jgi:hypothetical protein
MEKAELTVTDRIKTIDDAYADRGYTKEQKRPYLTPVDDFQEALNAVADAFVFTEALNEGVDPYANEDDEKWWPVFEMYDGDDESGFGFSGVGCGWARSYSYVGSRLAFNDSEIAKYAGKTFTSTYKAFMKKQPKQ